MKLIFLIKKITLKEMIGLCFLSSNRPQVIYAS